MSLILSVKYDENFSTSSGIESEVGSGLTFEPNKLFTDYFSNVKAKEYKTAMKSNKKNAISLNLTKKIRKLKSNNSKEYWNLIDKSTEGKTASNKKQYPNMK